MSFDEMYTFWTGHFALQTDEKLQRELDILRDIKQNKGGLRYMNTGLQAAYEACLKEYHKRLGTMLHDIIAERINA